jgi:hypothetical protein
MMPLFLAGNTRLPCRFSGIAAGRTAGFKQIDLPHKSTSRAPNRCKNLLTLRTGFRILRNFGATVITEKMRGAFHGAGKK